MQNRRARSKSRLRNRVVASVQNRTWHGRPHLRGGEFPAEKPTFVDNVEDMIRCAPRAVIYRRESALVESDGWSDSRGLDGNLT